MKIAIIGAGAMGSALAEGLLKGSVFKPEEIVIANPHQEKLKKFALFGGANHYRQLCCRKGSAVGCYCGEAVVG